MRQILPLLNASLAMFMTTIIEADVVLSLNALVKKLTSKGGEQSATKIWNRSVIIN